MIPLVIKHTGKSFLLRQNFFGLSRFMVVILLLGVAFTSQGDDFVVAITNQFLWLNFRDYRAMFANSFTLIDVRIPKTIPY